MNEKYRNYGLWLSIFALIPLVCKGYGLDILPKNYEEIITTLLAVLVALGVISSPKEGKGYTDQKEPITKDITNDMR